MRVNGKVKGTGELAQLSEVCITANPGVLRELASFILDCADRMERRQPHFDHDHFLHHFHALGRKTPDVVIGNPRSVR